MAQENLPMIAEFFFGSYLVTLLALVQMIAALFWAIIRKVSESYRKAIGEMMGR